jgi:hypothetical protein
MPYRIGNLLGFAAQPTELPVFFTAAWITGLANGLAAAHLLRTAAASS